MQQYCSGWGIPGLSKLQKDAEEYFVSMRILVQSLVFLPPSAFMYLGKCAILPFAEQPSVLSLILFQVGDFDALQS